MNRLLVILVLVLTCAISTMGCSGGGNPQVPDVSNNLTSEMAQKSLSETCLWGYYDVYVDIPTQTATAVPNRDVMFSANVVQFLNGKAANLQFTINGTPTGTGYVDVDIDVKITHPFPGLTQYNGYDVRGVFLSDGFGMMSYNNMLGYPILGTDQCMLNDPDDGDGGGADGYTRWFNAVEFTHQGLFGYTVGKVASPGYFPTATLNGYKYFADGLGAKEDAFTWLADNPEKHGVFSAGKTNTRNYYLRFPTPSPGVKYAYAVVANWIDATTHPANAPEAVAVKVDDDSSVYYVDDSTKGGSLEFDISLWDWDSIVNGTGVMDDYKIFIESTVLSGVHEASTTEMTPTGGGDDYSTYHFEIGADNIQGVEDNEYWIIAECTDEDYTNDYGVSNGAGNDPLAAFFRCDLYVSPTMLNNPPVAAATADETEIQATESVAFDGSGSTDADGTIAGWEWDFDGNGTYGDAADGGTADKPTKVYMTAGVYNVGLRVTDNEGASDTLDTPIVITVNAESGWAKTWGGNDYDTSMYTNIDAVGNIYVAGFFSSYNADFDPGPGEDLHSTKGSYDVFLSKFTPSGTFKWAITFGGSDDDRAYAVETDSTGIYVSGFFISSDFDPGSGTPVSTIGGWDCWMSKFDFDGNFIWSKTWGGTNHDHVYASATDGSGGVYVGGGFTSSDVDFDPDPGNVENLPSNGTWDSWISKFDSDGNFEWAGVWGWYYDESVNGIASQSGGNVYCSGNYGGQVDFNPDPGLSDLVTSYAWTPDAFVSCFSSSGVYQWVKTWEGGGDERAWKLSQDTSGNIYAAGILDGWIYLNPDDTAESYSSFGSWDAWLCKLDSAGGYLWGKGWGGYWNDMPYGMRTDGTNAYVTGYFRSPFVDFDPDSGDDTHNNAGDWNGEADIFLSKFDSSGNLSWAETWGSAGQDIGQGVVAGLSGSCYLTGSFSGTIDFKPGGGDSHDALGGSEDVFLMKLLPGGGW